MDLRGPSLGLVGTSIESERTLPRTYRPALDLGLFRPERAHSRPEEFFLCLRGPSLGLIGTCLGLRGLTVGLCGPFLGLR